MACYVNTALGEKLIIKAIQKVKGRDGEFYDREIAERVLHISRAFYPNGSEAEEGSDDGGTHDAQLWSLREKMPECGSEGCMSTACVNPVFSKEANAVETEEEILSTTLFQC